MKYEKEKKENGKGDMKNELEIMKNKKTREMIKSTLNGQVTHERGGGTWR